MNSTLLPVWVMLANSVTMAGVADAGPAAQSPRLASAAAVRPAQAPEQTPQPQPTKQDEYVRIELHAPETASFTLSLELAVTTSGATEWVMPVQSGRPTSDIAVTDMMTGQPLKFALVKDGLRITLARPVAGEGGQARLRVNMTIKDSSAYWRLHDSPHGVIPAASAPLAQERAHSGNSRTDDGPMVFIYGLIAPRMAIVLPAGHRLTYCNLPSQVLSLPDGRTMVSLMHQGSEAAKLQVRMRSGAQIGDAAKPRPLTNARSWEPPPAQGPTERTRLSERARQDRDIVYFLQPPETHAFSLYHDYTESREGTDKYLNVVRTGSSVSAPSGIVLDTGEAMKVEVLKGAQLKAAGIDAPGDQVEADQEVVVFRYPAVKPGQSLRLRLSETYTAPQSYRLDGDELVFERSFGRPRNSVVLPKGWYLTALSIPGVVRQTPDGETRIDFVNPRPDSIDVLIKGKKAAK